MGEKIIIDKKIEDIINKLLRYSKTKLINPIAFLAALNLLLKNKKIFTRKELEFNYKLAVEEIEKVTGSNLNIGGRFHADTYPDRMSRKYGAFEITRENKIKLPSFIINLPKEKQVELKKYILGKIIETQRSKIGNIQLIDSDEKRIEVASNKENFINFLIRELKRSANSFEITCFAILKVFLEKFACKLYRNSRTTARDTGIDISTDYGVVYQIKKFKIKAKKEIYDILKEVQINFDRSRIEDGKLILIIEDIEANFKHFVIDKNIKMLKMSEIIKLANQIDEIEDRMKILRVIYDENRRELESDI
jgi:hypothetical protein